MVHGAAIQPLLSPHCERVIGLFEPPLPQVGPSRLAFVKVQRSTMQYRDTAGAPNQIVPNNTPGVIIDCRKYCNIRTVNVMKRYLCDHDVQDTHLGARSGRCHQDGIQNYRTENLNSPRATLCVMRGQHQDLTVVSSLNTPRCGAAFPFQRPWRTHKYFASSNIPLQKDPTRNCGCCSRPSSTWVGTCEIPFSATFLRRTALVVKEPFQRDHNTCTQVL